MNKNILNNVDFSQFEDNFGNVIKQFKVIRYEKYSNGEWKEEKKIDSGRSYFIIDEQLYSRCDDSLLPMNMDFDSKTCGACYQIAEEIIDTRKITNNEILFTCNGVSSLSLHKQSYSDNTCFYSLQDCQGHYKLAYGSRNINDLINRLDKEIEAHKKSVKDSFINDCKELQETYRKTIEFKQDIINKLKSIFKECSTMKNIKSAIKTTILTGVITILSLMPNTTVQAEIIQPTNNTLRVINTYTESNDRYHIDKGDTITEYENSYTCTNKTINKYELYFPELGDWSINLNSQQEIKDVIKDSASHRHDLNDSINTIKDVKVINTYTKNDGSIVTEYNDYSWSLINTHTNKFIFMPAITSDYEMSFKSESDLKDCIDNYINVRCSNNC